MKNPSGIVVSTEDDIHREMCVIAGMMRYSPNIGDVVQTITAGDFWEPRCKIVFESLVSIFGQNSRPDHVSEEMVIDDICRRECVHLFEGLDGLKKFLRASLDADPTGMWCESYAGQMRDHSVRKQLGFLGHTIINEAAVPSQSVEDTIAMIQKTIGDLGSTRKGGEFHHIKVAVRQAMDEMDRKRDTKLSGITTGIHEIDEMTDGLQVGELSTIGARPSIGKTAFAVNIAKAAASNGSPVAFVSLEQAEKELAFRLLAGESGISSMAMRRQRISGDGVSKIIDASIRISELPIWVNDHGQQNARGIYSQMRRMKRQHEIKIVFIDYVQLISGDGKLARHEQIGEITRTLKFMARDLQLAVVLLAQVNRKSEDRAEERPKLSDLKDSGNIEQDSDVVILLHRTATGESIDDVEAILKKQRNGPTGTIRMAYRKATMTFENRGIE